MKFTAYRNGSTATITCTDPHNTTAIRLEAATGIGSEILAFFNPNAAPVDTPAYRIDPTETGLRISTGTGHFDLPWRWITTVGNALS